MMCTMTLDPQAHWQSVHMTRAVDAVSWWQGPEDLWVDLVEDLGLSADDVILDIGSGSAPLVDALLERGHRHLVAVDISPAALERIAHRVGDVPGLELVAADVRRFHARRPAALWHDRAVFHFLTDPADRDDYCRALRASVADGGHVIVATFASDGPESCSSLPVARYDAPELIAALGFDPDELVRAERRVHTTPWGATQPFTVVVLRMG